MQNRSWLVRSLISTLAGVCLIGAAPQPGQTGTDSLSNTQVTIIVTGLRSHDGLVQACMTSHPDEFPDCPSKSEDAYRMTVSASGDVKLQFTKVKAGRYAVALLHDENSNGKMDRMLVIPREGFGFSQDAKIKMGPPKFEEAAFTVGKTPVKQTIKTRYIL